MEMIFSTAICGVIWAIFGGQPMVIMGGTGPVLVFTRVLYEFNHDVLKQPFLPMYGVVGLWAGLFIVLVSVFNLSKYMRYCTRFTDEIFAALISFIFITIQLNNGLKNTHTLMILLAVSMNAMSLCFGFFFLSPPTVYSFVQSGSTIRLFPPKNSCHAR
eukprot:GABV01000787.1.p1 GENE.GABV01000787.1~~GABV01000787.1.p1  ORF type:complete len:159 (-),score=28.10 GABV01000787.1:592-1068(-)